jgi:hypothetical protein
MMEWIDDKLEQRGWEVVKVCEEENEDLSNRFNNIVNELKKITPESVHGSLYELEDICVQQSLIVRTAYRIGFDDAINLEGIFKR